MRKYFFIIILLFISTMIFCACSSGAEYNEKAMVKIGDTEYNSLAHAIEEAEDGETILIFNDTVESDKNLPNLTTASVDGLVYTVYEINKPLTIKGVIKDGKKPIVHGSFHLNIANDEYKENSITIENLEIVHGCINTTDNELNEKFSIGIHVISGSANIVENDIHLNKKLTNDEVQNYDLPLCYGIVLSRPKDSMILDQSFTYEISENRFGDYSNIKDNVFASAFSIVQNYEDLGSFSPSKLNRESTNFSLSVYENNYFSDNNYVYAMDYDGNSMTYKSLVTNNINVLSQEKLNDNDNQVVFIGDMISDNLISFDIFGCFVVTGSAENIVFNLMDKDAIAIIEKDKIGETIINKFTYKNLQN